MHKRSDYNKSWEISIYPSLTRIFLFSFFYVGITTSVVTIPQLHTLSKVHLRCLLILHGWGAAASTAGAVSKPRAEPHTKPTALFMQTYSLLACTLPFWTVWGPNSRWSQWRLNINTDWWHCNCILETTQQNKSGSAWHFNSNGCACSFLIASRAESSQMLTWQVQQEICKNIRPISFWL